MVTAPGLNNEENGSDCSSTAGRFSYCPYTDLLAIAAEAPWRSTPETDLDVCGADLNTTQDWDEPATALVTGGGAEELPQEDSTVVEQYSYCLYSDQAVIASEVSWLETQDALGKCSKAPIEFAQFENRTDVQPGLASKTTSVTSGSSTRTKKRKVYRPPAKGVSPRLSQEEVNKISLQRKKK
ncbi:hypothetical protein BJ741DRAFT_622047 [Chytriomyces cf. hyalinus JEL632]|nr:hypothetical protein BJ741DRAFT_622047 [Chytriomyces cf. hyalinus JEL632]